MAAEQIIIKIVDIPPDLNFLYCGCTYAAKDGETLKTEEYTLFEKDLEKIRDCQNGIIFDGEFEFSENADELLVGWGAGRSGNFERGELMRVIPGNELYNGVSISLEKEPK